MWAGACVFAFTGSSPIAPEVLEFLRDALLVPFYEGYGSTEAGMVRGRTTWRALWAHLHGLAFSILQDDIWPACLPEAANRMVSKSA